MRSIWILSEKTWSAVETGPHRRVRSLAQQAILDGYSVHVACPDWKCTPPDGIRQETLEPSLLDRIPPEDLVIISPFLPPRMVAKTLRSRQELHVDFYCVSAMEGLESSHRYAFWKRYLGRNRTWRRYELLISRCSRFYVSTEAQMHFLAGSLYSRIGCRRDRWLSDLPSRCIVAPMGIPRLPSGSGPTPYPDEISGRSIFLWGGGIWEWLDARFLIRSFATIPDKSKGPVLYFLAGSNPSGEPSQDLAPRQAVKMARELGLLGQNVFFHPTPVGPVELPPFLEHCSCGIMANHDNLESLASWRTRYLDLVAARKPLLVHRPDPLARIMSSIGVAQVVQATSAEDFSNRVIDYSGRCRGLSETPDWATIQHQLDDKVLLTQVSASWSEKHPPPPPPSLRSIFRWLAGL